MNQGAVDVIPIPLIFQAWFWDVFMSIPEEIRMYRKRKFRMPDAVYFMAR